MYTPGGSRPYSYFPGSSSRHAKCKTELFLGGTVLLLSLLVPGWSAYAQTTLTRATLAFGHHVVNMSSAPKTVTLKNTQAVPLTISRIAITGGNSPADYVWGGNCPLSPSRLGPGKSCTITVTLTPSALGEDNGTLSVTDNAPNGPQTATLTGTGVLPVTLSYTSLSFGNVGENSASSSKNITLYNNEAVALTISGITLSNLDYTETNTCNGSVAAKGACVITVTLTPSVLGADNGTLSVTDSASNSPQTATLMGTGVLPVTLSYTSLNFGNVGEKSPSSPKNIPIHNYEAEPLTISGITLSNPDYTETNNCNGSVAANSYCVITVTLTPSALGADNGTLTVIDNASNSPQTATLTGTGVLPVTLSNTSLNFGNVGEKSPSTSKNITLYNNGAAALNISITLSNPDYTETNTCNGSVAAEGTCVITVTLTPSALGADNGTLSVTDTASNSPQTATLTGTGTGTGAIASLSSSSLSFASQAVSASSAAQTLTLKNTGNAALSLTSITLTGTNASDFAQTNTCGASVAAGGSCTISVTFTPTASGTRTAVVTLTDNAAGSPQTVSLSGTGTAPVDGLSPTSLTFGNQSVGTTSTTQTATLSNTGNAALSISSIALTGTNPGDFAQTNTCGSSVAAGASCTISVTFTPVASGTRTAAVTLTDNAAGSPQTVSLTGTGTAAVASLSPSSLTFANQAVGATSAAQTITLNNTGNAALSLTSITLTGTNAGEFPQTNTCGSSVAAGASCTISVTFTPGASGTRTAAVTLTDNATGSPQTVSLSGTGTAAVASLSPSSLTFASQAVGASSAAQTITLNNTGNAALSLTSITLTGTNPGDFAQTNNCGSSVAAGASCTISVTFTPAASGTRTAAVTLTDNATGSPQTVSLSGTGTATVVSLSPTSLTFGSEPVDTTSSPQVVTLTNAGSAALNITSISITGANATDFTENNTCSSAVAAGGNCTITILFTPSASGTRTASLNIADSASGSPQSVSLSGTGTHDVILSWTASVTTGVTGYNVFRGTTSGGESATPLNPTPIAGTTYVDGTVTAGATYYYVVTTVASNDVTQSSDSQEAKAAVPSP